MSEDDNLVYAKYTKRCPAFNKEFSRTFKKRYFSCYDKECHVVLYNGDGDMILGNFGNRDPRKEESPREEGIYDPTNS